MKNDCKMLQVVEISHQKRPVYDDIFHRGEPRVKVQAQGFYLLTFQICHRHNQAGMLQEIPLQATSNERTFQILEEPDVKNKELNHTN